MIIKRTRDTGRLFIDGALIFRRKVGVSFYDYLNGKILSGHTANFSKTKRKVSHIDDFFFYQSFKFCFTVLFPLDIFRVKCYLFPPYRL